MQQISHRGYLKFLESLPFPKYLDILSWLVIANTCISVNQWSRVPLGNQWIVWLIDFPLLLLLIWYALKNRFLLFSRQYVFCSLYLLWACIGVVRGFFTASNYWEYKQLFTGILMTSLPYFAYLFREPRINYYILYRWNKVMPILFIIFFIWVCGPGYYFYLLPFVLLYGSFLPILPGKWKLIIGIILIAFCLDLSARSNLIKVAVTLATCIAYLFRKTIPYFAYKLVHWVLYLLAPLLLGLAISGSFNVLEEMSSKNEGQYVVSHGEDQEDLSGDTRTFIYVEVISSALNNNYVLFGNTPARGNYSEAFVAGDYALNEDLTGKGERHNNELVHLNIFTWLGIVGLILYSLIYLHSSCYAVYKSNSTFMKLIGCTIAFHWAYGWIEDFNSFTVQNIWLWMMIGMGYSKKFRMMDDKRFARWFTMLFINKRQVIEKV